MSIMPRKGRICKFYEGSRELRVLNMAAEEFEKGERWPCLKRLLCCREDCGYFKFCSKVF